MKSKKIDWRVVGLAMIPALGVSIVVAMAGNEMNDSVADRISQILLFPLFLGAYHYIKRRESSVGA